MSRTNDCSGDVLRETYKAMIDLYERGLSIVAGSHGQMETDVHDVIQELQPLLDEVRALERRVANPVKQWKKAGGKPSREFNEVLLRLEQIVQQLAKEIRLAEQKALEKLQIISRELEQTHRVRQMSEAYHKTTIQV